MDWGGLPIDLLGQILEKEIYGKDLINFRLVCKNWETAVLNSKFRKAPYLVRFCVLTWPWRWIFLQYNSPTSVQLPTLDRRFTHVEFSRHNWMLMRQFQPDPEFVFFNPFQNLTITLPLAENLYPYELTFFHKPTSEDCFVLGRRDLIEPRFCLFRLNSQEVEPLSYDGPLEWFACRPVLRNNFLYFVDHGGSISICDVNTKEWKSYRPVLPHPVRSSLETYMLVDDCKIYAVFVGEGGEIVVVELKEEGKEMNWTTVPNLGKKVFYLGVSSFAETARCPYMENMLYFNKALDHDIIRYSLDTGQFSTSRATVTFQEFRNINGINSSDWICHT